MKAITFALPTCMALYALPGLAQDQYSNIKQRHTPEQVIVSATRSANRVDQLPFAVSVATQQDVEAQQAYMISDVMKKLPGVDFGGGPRAAGQIPTIRGFSGKEISLLVDGARINDPGGISSPLYIDPFFIKQVEVIRGSTSSLYGSGGIGGAMVLQTLSASDLLDGRKFGGDLRLGYASADLSHHANARLYGRHDDFDALLALGHAGWDRIRQGDGTLLQPNDGDADTGLVKLGWQINQQLRLQLSHQFYNEQNLRPNNPEADTALGPVQAIPVQRNHTKQAHTVLKANVVSVQSNPILEATLYRTTLQRSADRNPAMPLLPTSNSMTATNGGSLQHSILFDTNALGHHRFIYGLDFSHDALAAHNSGVPNPVIPDGSQQLIGLFVQDEIGLGADWKLIPSLRADRFQTSDERRTLPSTSASHVSPKLTLSWQVTPQTMLFSSYGEAFRAPSVIELYQHLSGKNFLFNFAANPNLRPETDRTAELGATYNVKQVFSTNDNARLRLATFLSHVDDLIANTVIGTYDRSAPFSGTGVIQQYRNVSNAKRVGVELEGSYRRPQWHLTVAYSHIRIRDNNNGENLFSPPDKLHLQARYWLNHPDLSLLWNSSLVAAQRYDTTVQRRRSGYGVHDVFLSWSPHHTHTMRIDMGASNLFDKRYVSYQSSNLMANTVETGRNFKISLSKSL